MIPIWSEVKQFGWVDYGMFVAMLVVSALTGLYHGLRGPAASAHHHLTGGGDLATIPVGLSLLASFLSSITLMGQPSEVYRYGPQIWLFGPATFLMVPIVGYFMIPFFRQRNDFSAYQYFAERFNRQLQFAASLLFTVQMVFYLALVLYAPALAVNQVTGLDTMMVVTVMYFVCIFYTTLGGMKAVVWTDTFQVTVLMGAMVLVVMKGAQEVGGFSQVWAINAANNRTQFFKWEPEPTERFTVWSTLVGGSLLHMSAYGGNQLQVQRYLAVRSTSAARKMLWINAVGWTFVVILTTLTGLVIYATYHGCDPLLSHKITKPDQIFPLFVMDMLSAYPGFPGVFMCGIFSAGLSTVSTGMNSLAAIWYAEMSGTVFTKELEASTSATVVKLLALGFGVLSYMLVFVVPYLGGLVELGISLSSVCASSLFSLFILGIYFPKVNSWGAGCGLLAGVLVMTWICLGGVLSSMEGLAVAQQPLPASIHLCHFLNVTLPSDNSSGGGEAAWWVYRVSFLWYACITMVVTLVTGVVVSWLVPTSKQAALGPAHDPLLRPPLLPIVTLAKQ